MNKNLSGSTVFVELLKRVEKNNEAQPVDLEDSSELTDVERLALVQNLRIHQIELEMQNEELRRAHLELEKARDKYSDLYDFAPVGYFTISEQGTILEVNLTAASMLGVERALLFGKPFSRFITNDTQDIFYSYRRRLLEEVAPQTAEIKLLKKDGSEFHAELKCSVVQDEKGDSSRFRMAVSDISERKRADDELKKAHNELEKRVEERTSELAKANEQLNLEITDHRRTEQSLIASQTLYRELVENINELIWEVKINGVYTYLSPRVKDILGYEPEELLGKKLSSVMPPEESRRVNDLFVKIVEAQEPFVFFETTATHKNGFPIILEISGKPFFNVQGELIGYRGVNRDITELHRSREALQKSEDELRHLSIRLLEAHEEERRRLGLELHDGLAQILVTVKMRAELGLFKLNERDAKEVAATTLEFIVQRAQKAIDEIRRISRNLRPSTLDNLGIVATASSECDDFNEIFPEVKIEKQLDIREEDIPAPLKIVIFRILQEAFNNIAKHSQAKQVYFSLKQMGDKIELTIKDDGNGFNAERVSGRDVSEQGFGLVSMKERAELSKGCFSIESQEGKGTSIRALWNL